MRSLSAVSFFSAIFLFCHHTYVYLAFVSFPPPLVWVREGHSYHFVHDTLSVYMCFCRVYLCKSVCYALFAILFALLFALKVACAHNYL